jgi:hypothetical protein
MAQSLLTHGQASGLARASTSGPSTRSAVARPARRNRISLAVRAAALADAPQQQKFVRPDPSGRFGRFGGKYVPETLIPALAELELAYKTAQEDPSFQVGGRIDLRKASQAVGGIAMAPIALFKQHGSSEAAWGQRCGRRSANASARRTLHAQAPDAALRACSSRISPRSVGRAQRHPEGLRGPRDASVLCRAPLAALPPVRTWGRAGDPRSSACRTRRAAHRSCTSCGRKHTT